MNRGQSSLPSLTDDVSQAKADLREYGLALLAGQVPSAQLEAAREATYASADDDRRQNREADPFPLDYGRGNTRVWNVLDRHPVFREFVQLPVILELLRETIGWPALLGNISANIAEPGSDGGSLHADQLFVPRPWPAEAQGFNCSLVLDEFTADNGATEVISRSHRQTKVPDADDAVPIIAPAGTLVALDSRVWHRTGCNRSQRPRAAVFAWYTRPIYRTQENWFLSLDDAVVESASDVLLTLLGYRTQGLGLVYGRSPR